MSNSEEKCVCCNKKAKINIELVNDTHRGTNVTPRWYIPNQVARTITDGIRSRIEKVWFCSDCIRKVEDNLRATITYLQIENDILLPQPVTDNFKTAE
jgi:ribosomal protein L28